MIVYPAIDLMAGRAVRLRQGDTWRLTEVGDDPVALATRWAAGGAAWLHVVDLDGARSGAPVHLGIIERICRALPIPVQVGGGLRTRADLGAAFAAGAARAILGTAALAGDLLPAALEEFGDRIAVALDVRDGRAAVDGWQTTTAAPVLEVAVHLARVGVPRLIYTDVARDGMLEGPNLDGLAALLARVKIPVIVSGGVARPADVHAVAAAGAEGVIIGRALYEGRLTFIDAVRAATDMCGATGAAPGGTAPAGSAPAGAAPAGTH